MYKVLEVLEHHGRRDCAARDRDGRPARRERLGGREARELREVRVVWQVVVLVAQERRRLGPRGRWRDGLRTSSPAPLLAALLTRRGGRSRWLLLRTHFFAFALRTTMAPLFIHSHSCLVNILVLYQ